MKFYKVEGEFQTSPHYLFFLLLLLRAEAHFGGTTKLERFAFFQRDLSGGN